MSTINFKTDYQNKFNGEITNLDIEIAWLAQRDGTPRGLIVMAKYFADVTISDYVMFSSEKELLDECPKVEDLLHLFEDNDAWSGSDGGNNDRMLAMDSLTGVEDLYTVAKTDTPHIFYGN